MLETRKRQWHYPLALDRSCVLAFSFNDNHPTVRDSSIYHNNGIVTEAKKANFIDGLCLEFDGDNDNVVAADSASLDITSAITLMAWINPSDNLTNENGIISKNVYNLILTNNRKVRLELNAGGFHNFLSDATVPFDAWTHVAGVLDGENMIIYINGEADASEAETDSIATDSSAVYIGYHQLGAAFFPGKIARPFIFNRALSATEIRSEYSRFA